MKKVTKRNAALFAALEGTELSKAELKRTSGGFLFWVIQGMLLNKIMQRKEVADRPQILNVNANFQGH